MFCLIQFRRVRNEEILYLGTKQQLPALPNQKKHTEEELFAPYRLTVNLTVVAVQTDSFAWEDQEKEYHDTDGLNNRIKYAKWLQIKLKCITFITTNRGQTGTQNQCAKPVHLAF